LDEATQNEGAEVIKEERLQQPIYPLASRVKDEENKECQCSTSKERRNL
jgi:hypothetical protein